MSRCSSGTLILWIITGDVGGGAIVSNVAWVGFFTKFVCNRGSCGRGRPLVAGFPAVFPPVPLIISSSACTASSAVDRDDSNRPDLTTKVFPL